MIKFKINSNQFLDRDVSGYFHANFHGAGQPGNPDFLYKLKNDPHHKWSHQHLQSAIYDLHEVLSKDLPEIMRDVQLKSLTVCVVPRAKENGAYRYDQLLFKLAVGEYAKSTPGFRDGSDFIVRHTNTRTTHLRQPMTGFVNDGPMPYPGIALDTCDFSPQINGSDILLIDEIYTRTVNIDEDVMQALFCKGARSVVFYAIGNTPRKF